MSQFGKLLISTGIILILSGIVVYSLGKLPGAGRLPGDIYIKRGPVMFYFPIATCLLVSLILSLLMLFFGRK